MFNKYFLSYPLQTEKRSSAEIVLKEASEEEESPAPVSSLQFEDLSVLEKGFNFSSGVPRK